MEAKVNALRTDICSFAFLCAGGQDRSRRMRGIVRCDQLVVNNKSAAGPCSAAGGTHPFRGSNDVRRHWTVCYQAWEDAPCCGLSQRVDTAESPMVPSGPDLSSETVARS